MDAHIQSALEALIIGTKESFKLKTEQERRNAVLTLTNEFKNRVETWAEIPRFKQSGYVKQKSSTHKLACWRRKLLEYEEKDRIKMECCANSITKDKMPITDAMDFYQYAFNKIKAITKFFNRRAQDANNEQYQTAVLTLYAQDDLPLVEISKRLQISMLAICDIIFTIRPDDVQKIILSRII